MDEAKDGDEDDEECAQYLAESVCQRPPPFDGSMCCLLSLSSSAKLRLPEDAACSTMCTLHISVLSNVHYALLQQTEVNLTIHMHAILWKCIAQGLHSWDPQWNGKRDPNETPKESPKGFLKRPQSPTGTPKRTPKRTPNGINKGIPKRLPKERPIGTEKDWYQQRNPQQDSQKNLQ